MAALYDQPAQPAPRLAGKKHRNTPAQRIANQPVVPNMIVRQRFLQPQANLGETTDPDLARTTVTRQIDIQLRISAERGAYRLPLPAVAGKTV